MNNLNKISKIFEHRFRKSQAEFLRSLQYGPEYVDPIYDKQELEEIMDHPGDVSYKPIKALQGDIMSFKFNDPLLNTFINMVMVYSNKTLARELLAKTFETIKWKQIREWHLSKMDKTKSSTTDDEVEINPLTIFHKAVENAKPLMHLTNVKRGGSTYQVPTPINPNYSQFKALKWILEASKDKEGTVMFPDKLAWELIDASQNKGGIIKKKRDLHTLCEANKAYAHFRWGK